MESKAEQFQTAVNVRLSAGICIPLPMRLSNKNGRRPDPVRPSGLEVTSSRCPSAVPHGTDESEERCPTGDTQLQSGGAWLATHCPGELWSTCVPEEDHLVSFSIARLSLFKRLVVNGGKVFVHSLLIAIYVQQGNVGYFLVTIQLVSADEIQPSLDCMVTGPPAGPLRTRPAALLVVGSSAPCHCTSPSRAAVRYPVIRSANKRSRASSMPPSVFFCGRLLSRASHMTRPHAPLDMTGSWLQRMPATPPLRPLDHSFSSLVSYAIIGTESVRPASPLAPQSLLRPLGWRASPPTTKPRLQHLDGVRIVRGGVRDPFDGAPCQTCRQVGELPWLMDARQELVPEGRKLEHISRKLRQLPICVPHSPAPVVAVVCIRWSFRLVSLMLPDLSSRGGFCSIDFPGHSPGMRPIFQASLGCRRGALVSHN
ncbi:hypothetical protein T10_4069 [Trichinella papuae]|uniref:Uncharacterized protein n=1 Tax=Trichinella papuae TaxID=268474 RepID=A0A0V1MT68_9BILA|nr:hypothetical protein T10_4069 [Trichinella papuae]